MVNLNSEGSQLPPDQQEVDPLSNSLDRIARANGELVTLDGKRSRLDEVFCVSARYGKTDALGEGVDHVLLVDLFAKRDADLYPVGHYDWDIKGAMAVSNVNRRQGGFWNRAAAFEVNDELFVNYVAKHGSNGMRHLQEIGLSSDVEGLKRPVYLQFGLGTLLLGLSAYILQKQGVLQREFVSTNRLAGRIWEAYGIEITSPIELSRVTNHPLFRKITEEFIGK